MRLKNIFCAAALTAGILFSSCSFLTSFENEENKISITSISMGKNALATSVGSKEYVSINVKPASVQKDIKLSWTYDSNIIDCDTSSNWGVTITGKAEGQTIEVKSAQYGCPESLFDTLSSFSNQSSGGTIVFGLDEHNEFELCGVYDAQDLQRKVTQQCNQMEPVVRALFTVAEIEGKTLVAAEIPSVKISLRPVHYKGAGIVRGSFVRVGDSDEHMTEYEVYNLEAFRERIRNDARPVNGASPDMLNNNRVERYLESIRRNKPKLAACLTPSDILERTGVVTKGSPTIAGLMVFSD